MKKDASMPKVSVIIVNYNSSSLINGCLASLFEKTADIGFEVIIVDNATEKLEDVIAYAGRPEIKLMQLEENVGFGRANNAGAAIASGEYLFCLNPDTLLMNNAVKVLSDFMDAHKNCGVCGGNLYDAEGSPTYSFRRLSPGVMHEINELFHLMPEKLVCGRNRIHNFSGVPLEVFYVTGADLMIRRELFERLGGFSDDFFMYYEETDLCKRVRNEGWSVWSVPEARIIHLESGSFTGTPSEFKMRLLEQGRLTYHHRNVSAFKRFFANTFYKVFLLSGSVISRNPDKREYYKQRRAIYDKLRRNQSSQD